LSDGSTTVTTNGDGEGLVYSGDYSANFVPLSLVHKQYVDIAIAQIGSRQTYSPTLRQSNGVPITGAVIQGVQYTQIGKQVTVYAYINVSSATTATEANT